jgi:competence protein ComEC
MYYFGRFSCYFFLTNFVAIPVLYVVLYCALAFFLFSFVPVVQAFFALVMQSVVGWLIAALKWFSSFPFASINDINISPLQMLMIYALVCCLYGIVYYLHKGYVQAGLRRNR